MTPPKYPKFDGSQNCASTSTIEWFREEPATTYSNEETLTRICSTCAFQAPCLEYALHTTVHGWWGGTSEFQRQQIRKQRNITPFPIDAIINRTT